MDVSPCREQGLLPTNQGWVAKSKNRRNIISSSVAIESFWLVPSTSNQSLLLRPLIRIVGMQSCQHQSFLIPSIDPSDSIDQIYVSRQCAMHKYQYQSSVSQAGFELKVSVGVSMSPALQLVTVQSTVLASSCEISIFHWNFQPRIHIIIQFFVKGSTFISRIGTWNLQSTSPSSLICCHSVSQRSLGRCQMLPSWIPNSVLFLSVHPGIKPYGGWTSITFSCCVKTSDP